MSNENQPEITEEEEQRLLDNDGNVIDADYAMIDVNEEELLGGATGKEAGSVKNPLGTATKDRSDKEQRNAGVPKVATDLDTALEKLRACQAELRSMTELKDKRERERNELAAEVDHLKKEALGNETSKSSPVQYDCEVSLSQRLERLRESERPRAAQLCPPQLATTFRPPEMTAMDGIKETSESTSRTHLHPDFECTACGGKELKSILDGVEVIGDLYTAMFRTMREAAALLDMVAETAGQKKKSRSLLEIRHELMRRVREKDVSSRSLKRAYLKGLCRHQVDAAMGVVQTGVVIEDEKECVSSAVTSVLVSGSGRVSRKGTVAFIPNDCPVWNAQDGEKEIEFTKYQDEKEMRSAMKNWEKENIFPKVIFIVLKGTFSEKTMDGIRVDCEEIVKKVDVTIYISGDLLPLKNDDFKSEAVQAQQSWLTLWRLDNPKTNLVVVSPVSGLLNKNHSFATLFVVARRESRLLLESAIKHVVDGAPMPIWSSAMKENPIATAKRSAEFTGYKGSWDVASPSTKSSDSNSQAAYWSDKPCFNCQEIGHGYKMCKQPKKKFKKN